MIIAVDFDGTLCTNDYPKIGEPITEVIEYIKGRKAMGDELILWTCRSGQLLFNAIEWCREQGITFDTINDNIQRLNEQYGNNSRKVYADIYLDDKAMNIEEVGRSNG